MEKIIYQLTVADIQNVAMQELDRELTADEIELVSERVAYYIPWYDAISEAISEKIKDVK